MVYVTIKDCFEGVWFVCGVQIQFRIQQVEKVVTGQNMCWTINEEMKVILGSKEAERTGWCVMDVIFEPVGIQPTEFESQTSEQMAVVATTEFVIV